VRVIIDGRQGYAWSGSLDDNVVLETLEEARDNASFSAPDEYQALATPADAASAPPVELDLWRDDVLRTSADDKVALALALEEASRAADPRIRGLRSASYGDSAVESAIVNSLGVEATSRRTVTSCFTLVLAGEGAGTQTGVGFSFGRSFADIDLNEAASMAAEKAVRMLGATQPKSRRLPVVLDPMVTSSLFALIGAALNGEAVLKGRSMFAGRDGEQVAAEHVTIVDDPTNPDAFGAGTYDAEGVPTRRTNLIAGGVLAGFLHNTYTARRSGGTTTGSAMRGGFKSTPGVGARALLVQPGSDTPDEILARAGDAVYVQSVQGLHSGANPVSGDFSVGAEGLMLRNGAFAEPVREVTIASTLQRILNDIVSIGSDVTWLPGGAAGMTLLLGEMTMSGS
jgi:PmbA protein